MRNKDRNIEGNLDNGYWTHGGGMQQRRELFVNNPDKERELLDDLELQSMDGLQLESADLGVSSTSHAWVTDLRKRSTLNKMRTRV